MADQTKEMTITVKSVQKSDRTTSKGGAMYNVGFEVGGIGTRAVCFSETIAAELEKFVGKDVKVEMKIGEYNGAPSYTILSANDVKTSGFKKGGGYQKDVVSIERQVAAKLAVELAGLRAEKDLLKNFEKDADKIYVWISKRPTEAKASGGATEQKVVDEGTPIDLEEVPFP